MKTLKRILIICLQLVLMSSSCKNESSYYDYRLKVINKSDKTIDIDYSQVFPDTTINNVPYFYHNTGKAMPNGTITLVRGGTWENAFKDDIHQKLIIFIFNATIVDNTPWDTIRKKYLILKRYELTLKDLDSLNFNVTYP